MNLDEHYSQLHHLGEGGTCHVFRGQDLQLGRLVAIKVIDLAVQPAHRAVFEAQCLAQFNHPNIVQIYRIHEGDNQLILEMEYVNGATLANWLQRGPISVRDKLNVLIDIANGLSAAHSKGVLHLDLKMQNVLVSEEGVAKIADFGIAELIGRQAGDYVSQGSLLVMSPELFAGAAVNQKSDLFSLGIIAYQLFSGVHPYQAQAKNASSQAIAQEIKSRPCQIDATQLKGIPDSLGCLINQLLEKQPDKRPESSLKVRQQLQQILSAFQNETTNPTLDLTNINVDDSVRLGKWVKVGACMCLLAILTGMSVWLYNKASIFPPVSIAIMPPEYTQTSTAVEAQRQSLSLAVSDAIQTYLIDHERYSVIAPTEVRRVQGLLGEGASIKAIANALNSRHVVSILLDCNVHACDMRFHLIDGDSATILDGINSATDTESFISAFNATAEAISLLTEGKAALPLTESADETFFESYISLTTETESASRPASTLLNEVQRLIETRPSFIPLYSLYRKIAIRSFKNSGDASVLADLENALRYAPSQYHNSEAYLLDELALFGVRKERGNERVLLGKIMDSSLQEYQRQTLLAIYFRYLGDFTRSLTHAEKAYQLHASLLMARNLAIGYMRQGRFEKALVYLQRVVSTAPNDWVARQSLADIALLMGELNVAKMSYSTLIENQKDTITTHSNYAVTLLLSGEFELALHHVELALQTSPDNHTLWLNRADIFAHLGKQHDALAQYRLLESAMSGHKGAANEQLLLAQGLAHLGKGHEALARVNSVLNTNPDLPEAYFVKALVQTLLNEPYSALASIEQSTQKGWSPAFYRLKWFKPLCSEADFRRILGPEHKDYLCQ
ncbi:protein kinase [Aestuariibacter sp. AA17]|uniref:Protein kinase n=1 Tax=Fluctibacter corallii TaxID=2984329 RepID=A0ABT3ACD7_9ALTE|nr:serine/threonine-protein kinase [Aestuariibacter sp. AA17]MCV2886339.1 protein kinase [Aestuariibacter sp. AA17]